MSEAYDRDEDETVHTLSAAPNPVMAQWQRFRPLFEEAMGAGFHTIEDLEQKIMHRRAFFFPGKDSALVGEIVAYPGGEKTMQFTWAAGDVAEIVSMLPGVEAISRMMGCTSILVEGRAAWKRVLATSGYEPWSVTLKKGL